MSTHQREPAQRRLVHRLIDWERVRARCERYPAIRRAFPLPLMQDRSEDPPYYCHYMAWRLGTWEQESLFRRMEELLRGAEELPYWKHERSMLGSADFADYWSLVWHMQVAEHLCAIGTDVSWSKAGPDLGVLVDGQPWYVECYKPTKSFGLFLFLEEIIRKARPGLCASYDLCMPFELPRNSERSVFLDTVLRRVLDPRAFEEAEKRARRRYPQVLYSDPNSSLRVFVEGANPDAYEPGVVPDRTGDPTAYLRRALAEAIHAKRWSNDLESHRPNLLAVNFVLSTDYQIAGGLNRPGVATPRLSASGIDVLAVCSVGIDRRLTRESLRAEVLSGGVDHSSLEKIACVRR